jgi:hypothetical protein
MLIYAQLASFLAKSVSSVVVGICTKTIVCGLNVFLPRFKEVLYSVVPLDLIH